MSLHTRSHLRWRSLSAGAAARSCRRGWLEEKAPTVCLDQSPSAKASAVSRTAVLSHSSSRVLPCTVKSTKKTRATRMASSRLSLAAAQSSRVLLTASNMCGRRRSQLERCSRYVGLRDATKRARSTGEREVMGSFWRCCHSPSSAATCSAGGLDSRGDTKCAAPSLLQAPTAVAWRRSR